MQDTTSIKQIISARELSKIKKKLFLRFIFTMFIVFSLLVLLTWYGSRWLVTSALDQAARQAQENSNTVHSLYKNDLDFLKNIVFQLHSESELQRFIIDRNELSREFILENWTTVIEQVDWISQIRYLSNSGYELLRVEYDRELGYAVTSSSPQNKSDQVYFQKARDLASNQLYISPISLNKEYNEFSYPLTPVIRFAMPVTQPLGRASGVLVVNIFADKFFTMFNDIMTTSAGNTLILDKQGNYIQNAEQQQDWSFEINPQSSQSFKELQPDYWSEMQQVDKGVIANQRTRLVFQSLPDIVHHGDHNRYLLIQEVADEDVKHLYQANLHTIYILFPIVLLMTWFLLRSKHKDQVIIEVEHNSLELVSALFYSKESICITDDKWHISAVNEAFCQSMGYTAEEVDGMGCEELNFIENKDVLKSIHRDIDKHGFCIREVQNERKDGKLITYLMFASSTYNQNGTLSHYVLQMIDISDRKRMENELKIAAAAFHTRSAITITDSNGNIIHANKAFTEITGYSLDEVVGKNPRILSSGKHDQSFYENLWQEIIQNGFWQGEIWNKHKNGNIYPEWIKISSVKDNKGEVAYYVATFEDITERKRLEEEIRVIRNTQSDS